MSEWKELKLGNVVMFQRGHDLPKTDMKVGTYPVAGSNGIIGYHNTFTTKAPGITIGRSGNIGTPHFYKEDFWSHNTVLFIKDFKGNSEKFIYYFLKTLDFTQFNTGSAVPSLNRNHIHELAVSIPLLSEQHAIASVLTGLDDKIDLLHRQNTTLEKMAEALFRKWFVVEAMEDWEEVSLKEFITIKHGYAFKGNYITAEPTNLILVTPGNFRIGGGFKFDKFKYYTNDKFPQDYILKAGDLIVTMTDLSVDGNTLGYSAFVPENYSNEVYLHNQRIGKVEFKNEIGKYFVHQLMKTDDYQWFVLGGASGTAIRHTSPTSICNYSFQMPPKSKILEFETFAKGIEEKNKNNQTQIRTLTALRDTLLPKLMSGEVRIEMKK